jgi:hypothetical protein
MQQDLSQSTGDIEGSSERIEQDHGMEIANQIRKLSIYVRRFR